MNNLKSKFKVKSALILLVVLWLVLWLAFINPNSSSPALTLVPFALILLLLYLLFSWVARQFGRATSQTRRQKALSLLFSLLLFALLVLSSLRQLQVKDGIILLAITVFGYFYAVKIMPTTEPKQD